ncbi:MAG: chorismate synthase, partial [bacterium]|nr:chorismate synthase [bacterium]
MTTFGESHGPAIGSVLDGVRPGVPIDIEDLQKELDRRRPGQSALTTPRNEADRVQILSGVFEGKTTGAPIAMVIFNRDQDSTKYEALRDAFRPGHADFTYYKKYGIRDHRGGGRSSGRETAGRVVCGAVARKILAERGVRIVG